MIAVNNILKRVCKLNWFEFIGNSNICAENLFEDILHLNDDGKIILANNFTYVLNRFTLLNEKNYNGTSKNGFLLKVDFYYDNDASFNISNSSDIKESYHSICDDVIGNPDLRALRRKNVNKLIIAHINVNSLRNEFLREQIQDNIDILMISETKIDGSFPIGQFLLNRYSTSFRQDRNAYGGGIQLYVWEDIPAKLFLWKKTLLKAF